TTLKEQVKTKYDEIARRGEKAGCGCGCGTEVSMIGDEYEGAEGYVAGADLGLGCGMPTDLAGLEAGQTVLDLGSGAGLDAFIARSVVGEGGRVIGVDMTPSMTEKARSNASELGFDNVEFRDGDIEDLPVESDSIDVVISNCVLNLVPDKPRAFDEMYRVLAPGGRFCVSDVVVRGRLPESLKRSAELYAGCVAGAIPREEYVDLLRAAGFTDVEVARAKVIEVPDDVLREAASEDDLARFRANGGGLLSVTVRGTKPAASSR
ncbi:MAG: arsenite methyltransferase, partial [Rhodothermales bacterium]